MEAFGNYLLKSAVWLTGFTLVFLVFLRNERYFRLNRAYLLSGIFASVVFPFYTWHYAVMLPSLPAAEISIPDVTEQLTITAPATAAATSSGIPNTIVVRDSSGNINAGLAAAKQIVGYIKNGDKTFQVNK